MCCSTHAVVTRRTVLILNCETVTFSCTYKITWHSSYSNCMLKVRRRNGEKVQTACKGNGTSQRDRSGKKNSTTRIMEANGPSPLTCEPNRRGMCGAVSHFSP
uniref:Uncharacterized protein n=1 Tax=Trypanosoma congolense (strain IL3000) TaxID=1068625 RepID=G0UMW3_TRYCI|nr:hypothetical protein, unlikely [Trypanosoma congolense IL3000]